MVASGKKRLTIVAIVIALAGCRTEEQRRKPPPFNPPYSSVPIGEHGSAAAEPAARMHVDPAVQLASAQAPIPPGENGQPGFPMTPAETIVTPAQPQPLVLSLFDAVEMA